MPNCRSSFAFPADWFIFGREPAIMKKVLYLLFFSFFFAGARAQTAVADAGTLQVKETEYNFGKIPQGKPVYHFFEITNTSGKPLKLDNVQASCGCTTPEWSRDEIAPGATAKIKVGYNAAAEGQFDKPVVITYNGSETKTIKIKGEVWKAPSGAPANASVSFLKQQLQ